MNTVIGIFSLVTALLITARLIKHPIDLKAARDTLRRFIDTLAKDIYLVVCGLGLSVLSSWVVWLCFGGGV